MKLIISICQWIRTCNMISCQCHRKCHLCDPILLTSVHFSRRMDATLKELAGLIKQMNPDARKKNTFIDFYIVFPHAHAGKYVQRDIGSICVGK